MPHIPHTRLGFGVVLLKIFQTVNFFTLKERHMEQWVCMCVLRRGYECGCTCESVYNNSNSSSSGGGLKVHTED